jgi:hypothetical protein
MTHGVQLDPNTEDRLREIGPVDLLVGIPSFNNARTIGHVVRAAAAGLAKYFPGQKAVIINSDGGSKDGTQEVVAAADMSLPSALLVSHPVSPVHKIVTPYHGIPGKGSAFRTVFAIARRLEARACAVFDSDLRSIAPGWVELLLGPQISASHDFVSPLYLRHKYDGTITNSIVYPLTRALYGKDVRQPIGGDFGFSGRLAEHYLKQPVWDSDVARFGIDIWMTTTALAGGFSVCQSFLGAKIHDAKDPGADLKTMFIQVVSALFDLMCSYRSRWSLGQPVAEVPLYGFPHGVGLEPVSVNTPRMLGVFSQAVRDLEEVWRRALSPETLEAILALPPAKPETFHFSDELWVRIVYDMALAFKDNVLPVDQLLGSLVPLYLGRTSSFVLETAQSDATEVERAVKRLGDEFVAQRDDLVRRWDHGKAPKAPKREGGTTNVESSPR